MKAFLADRFNEALENVRDGRVAQRSFQREALKTSRERDSGLVIAAYLAVAADGRLVQAHLPGIAPEQPETRGECDGFSADSQRRLLAFLHTIRRDAGLPVMVTLTFPAEVSVSAVEAKQCRRAWAKRCRREHPAWCSLWRIEAHPEMSRRLGRMHPHFHLLTWGAYYDFAWVSETWTSCIWKVLKLDECLADEHGDLVRSKHQAAGTNCERVRKWAGVAYCAKSYIAKEEEYPIGKAGRIWGWDFRDNIPLAKVVIIPLTTAEAVQVRLGIEAWMRSKNIVSEHLICTFFDDAPTEFAAKLRRGGLP